MIHTALSHIHIWTASLLFINRFLHIRTFCEYAENEFSRQRPGPLSFRRNNRQPFLSAGFRFFLYSHCFIKAETWYSPDKSAGCPTGDPHPPADPVFPMCPPSSLIVTQKFYKTSFSSKRQHMKNYPGFEYTLFIIFEFVLYL